MEQLIQEILKLSEAGQWEKAKLEWQLEDIWFEPRGTCLGGHFPITEHCRIENELNHNRAVVGNCCVRRFIGLPSNEIFAAFKRVKRDPLKSLNQSTLDYAKRRLWINDREYDFYSDIVSKRKLSPKQESYKRYINETIIARIGKPRLAAPPATRLPPAQAVPATWRRVPRLGVGRLAWHALNRAAKPPRA